ncbi:hypothetical protein [uncultured Muribaculum sp.]|uniref:hypothetical protein n=1 Tax=uncultured Muribaculum sp. TaxID=1918613 RepID=UPI0025D7F0A7|nr:hypothetical protein [uncultured Muribaculum sp.]
MSNAANKPFSIITSAIVTAGMLLTTSCSGSSKDGQQGEMLLQQADSAANVRDFTLALELLDTIKSQFPTEISLQRKAMALRPKVEEGGTIREIEQTDSLSAYISYRIDSIMPQFKLVHDPSLGDDYDYYVIKEYAQSNLFSRTGVEGRVEPSGEYKVLSSLTASPVRHTSISLSGAAGEVTTATVPYDGERNYRSGGTEMITFIGADCDTLGNWLSNNTAAGPVKLIFKGDRTYSAQLSANDRRSLAEGWKLSSFMKERRRLGVKRDFLERKLALTRDQIARTAEQTQQ